MKYLSLTPANCKNCYKCLRACPVKAIKFKGEQAEIVNERCIACSICRAVCPQNSLEITSELELVEKAILSNKKLIASVAPSFAGAFDMSPGKLVAALKKLGFHYVEETALGAEVVTKTYNEYIENTTQDIYITTACPSTNYLVEKYYPDLIKYLLPVVSPMIAHGELIKKHYGDDAFVVFIGPCTGKKVESHSYVNIDEYINAVLSFDEIKEWIEEKSINIASLKIEDFDRNTLKGKRAYPFTGGIIDSLNIDQSKRPIKMLSISGSEDSIDILTSVRNGYIHNALIEISSCKGSCIGGINMENHRHNYYKRMQKVKTYLDSRKNIPVEEISSELFNLSFKRSFIDKSVSKPKATEMQIENILKEMGKYKKEDELNCGVCGYNTCREKAQAIHEGMAESSMCLYYMRSKAESLTNVIFENTASCIIFLDGQMNIKEINPAAEKVFMVNADTIKDKPVSILIDDSDFRLARSTGKNVIGKRVALPQYNVVFIESIIYLPKHDMIMVSMTNVLEAEKNKKKLQQLRETTLIATQDVIEKQMRVAQEIASLLGETTAETKMVLTKLKKLVEAEDGDIQ